MKLRLLLLLGSCGSAIFAGCASEAVFFHESTKLGFSAIYNAADSQPVSSDLGFKRRIVAVLPAQERVAGPDGKAETGTNSGEALSLVSKFYVTAGAGNGVIIRTNFATGEAARALTLGSSAGAAVRALLHNDTVVVPESSSANAQATPPAAMVAAKVRQITGPSATPKPTPRAKATPPPARREIDAEGTLRQLPAATPTPTP